MLKISYDYVEVESLKEKIQSAISRPKLSFLADRGLCSAGAVQGSSLRRPHAWSGAVPLSMAEETDTFLPC
jgi:hypothetical protein